VQTGNLRDKQLASAGVRCNLCLLLAYSCQRTSVLQTYGARKVLAPESYVLAAKAPTKTANSTRRGTSTNDSLPSHCTTTKEAVEDLAAYTLRIVLLASHIFHTYGDTLCYCMLVSCADNLCEHLVHRATACRAPRASCRAEELVTTI